MDSKNKFWRGVMVGVLVTALVCLITVGASAGIYMFGRRVIDNQTQVQVQTEGTPSQAQEPVNFENVTKKLEQIQDIIDKKYLFEEKIDTSEEEAGIYQGFLSGLNYLLDYGCGFLVNNEIFVLVHEVAIHRLACDRLATHAF